MRKGLLAAAAALGLVIAAAAYAGTPSSAGPQSAEGTLVTCGTTRTIGLLAPITGPAASLGATQVKWVEYYVSTYNKTHRTKFRLRKADTKLGGPVSEAVKAARLLAPDENVLAVVGAAGSQEVEATTATLKGGGVAFVSGSATRTTLTKGTARRGYFFRTVPPDAFQSRDAVAYIRTKLRARNVFIIDDQSSYSKGLADEVQAKLRSAGISVNRESVSQNESNFASLIATIERDTNVVYIPWQLPPRGQAFGRQMRSAGKGNITLFGGDGMFDPAVSGIGSNVYVSFFPIQPTNKTIKAYQRSHGGKGDFFGAPSYVAAQVVGGAIERACRNGEATRAEVRREIARTRIGSTLLGSPVRFSRGGDVNPSKFGIYRSRNGQFARVG
jgi:branched-chain amino acid transport system substrate-binding protein